MVSRERECGHAQYPDDGDRGDMLFDKWTLHTLTRIRSIGSTRCHLSLRMRELGMLLE